MTCKVQTVFLYIHNAIFNLNKNSDLFLEFEYDYLANLVVDAV